MRRGDDLRVPSVMKSGNLNLLDPSRPRRPVTGITYPYCRTHNIVTILLHGCVDTGVFRQMASAFATYNARKNVKGEKHTVNRRETQ